jgi:hypothetical protein
VHLVKQLHSYVIINRNEKWTYFGESVSSRNIAVRDPPPTPLNTHRALFPQPANGADRVLASGTSLTSTDAPARSDARERPPIPGYGGLKHRPPRHRRWARGQATEPFGARLSTRLIRRCSPVAVARCTPLQCNGPTATGRCTLHFPMGVQLQRAGAALRRHAANAFRYLEGRRIAERIQINLLPLAK